MKIKCNVNSCLYNSHNTCRNKTVRIEGLFSNSSLGTFCIDFVNKDINYGPKHSYQIIECNSHRCKFNESGKCIKDSIEINSHKANYRSETQCSSFELYTGGEKNDNN